jgi:hypothetical protein
MVEEGGIRYASKVYRSLSSAAMAAAKDLGLVNKTQNGFIFWGLCKQWRHEADPMAALERAWERYHSNLQSAVTNGLTDEDRCRVVEVIRTHADVINGFQQKVT